TGVKNHSSELRLVRYILFTLKSGDVVIDAGAHLGYFTMVMAACVSGEGTVIAFEPSVKTGEYLRKNMLHKLQVRTEQMMLSSSKGESTFHEFPLKYSEFNTSIQRVSKKTMSSTSRVVQMTSLDAYCKENEIMPGFVKIDLAGGEYNVIKGAMHILTHVEKIALRLRKNDYEMLYGPAVTLLVQAGFVAFRINDQGVLVRMSDIDAYVSSLTEESDHIIFRKFIG
ncbi:MAG TPA: FkbM family methyltransferase, partial [Saprospiraceae bacterium]|nr:FkbM family methyltransferase [Saprospiraceae bacterium]